MSCLILKVPHETARLLGEVQVPGEKVPQGEQHITLVYLGKNTPVNKVLAAAEEVYEVARKTRPFTVRTSLVTSFPSNDDGIPIIARVESDALHALRKQIVAAFDKNGIEYDKKFPTYKPHVSLAFLKEGKAEEQTIPTIEWGAHEIIMWGGDHGDSRVVVTIPLSLRDPEDS